MRREVEIRGNCLVRRLCNRVMRFGERSARLDRLLVGGGLRQSWKVYVMAGGYCFGPMPVARSCNESTSVMCIRMRVD